MSDEIPSIISHVSLGTNDCQRAVAFYDRVLAVPGCRMFNPPPWVMAPTWVSWPIPGRVEQALTDPGVYSYGNPAVQSFQPGTSFS